MNTTYKLKNGKILTVQDEYISGMAGERMHILIFAIKGQLVRYDDVKDQLSAKHRHDIEGLIADYFEENHTSAITQTQ